MSPNPAEVLLEAAIGAVGNAYAPYSGFKVGAALETAEGVLFTGCNVENVSYGLTNCAERTAVFAAVAAGHTSFTRLAIVADGEALPYPCGACRQVLAEFCEPDMEIWIAPVSDPGACEQYTLGELLPKMFRFL